MTQARPNRLPAVAVAWLATAAGLLVVSWVPHAEAAGAFQAATTATSAGAAATSLTINVPAGTAVNDQLLAQVVVGGGSTITITPPSGWTLVVSVNSGGTAAVDLIQSVYRHTATASEPASYAWTFTSGKAAGAMLRYSGVDTDIPIDASATTFTSATGSNPSAPASTASFGDETVVHFVGKNDASTFTAAAGTTERSDSGAAGAVAPGTESSDETQTLSGATTARSSTASTTVPTASVVGTTVVLRTQSSIKLRGITLPSTAAPGNTVALTPPAATVQRDLMVAQIVADSAAAISTPSGWTQVISTPSAGTTTNDIRQSIFIKVAAATETSAYTFTSTPAKKMDGALFVYAGVDDTNPTDGTTSSSVGTATTTATAPAITTTKANDLLLGFFACGAGNCDPFTQPSSMNERVDTGQTPVVGTANGDFAFAADDKPLGAAATVASFSSTVSGSALITIGTTMALRPADVAFSAATSQAYETAGSAALAVTLSGAISVPVTVSYAVTGGTATSGTDYTLAAGSLSFAAGTTSASISITIIDDSNPDNPDGVTARDETVVVTLSGPLNANLGAQASHTFTIQDDEPKTTASVVNSAGGTLSAAWGGWSSTAGASNVASSNYLKVVNSDPQSTARPVVTVDFTPSSMTGTTDATQTIALDSNIAFSCKEDTTGTATPGSLSFPAFGSVSGSGSTTVTFTSGTGSVWYCRYQLSALPNPVLDQDYQASYTVAAP
jgi:hypothetical protein